MCVTCGCSQAGQAQIEGEHRHSLVLLTAHTHPHAPAVDLRPRTLRDEPPMELITLQTSLLDKNQRSADQNRDWLKSHAVIALNLMSSPGAGKTTLLVRTLTDLAGEIPMSVVEGDQETTVDADRIRATGARAIQINTGTGCHLDADMLRRALDTLVPTPGSLMFIENVGNLVCPALFDLGERSRVVTLSVTEGEDKPLKYPHLFRTAHLLLLTKIDLLPYTGFNVELALAHARTVNPDLQCLPLSARSGEGLPQWYNWLRALRNEWRNHG